MTCPLVHDPHALGPGVGCELALGLELDKLELVAGVRDGARQAETVTGREGGSIPGVDGEDIVPVLVDEVLLVI